MKKEIRKIFISLALFSFAGGVFYNFQELWLAENNLSINTIGTILSIAAVISVSVIFLSANIIKMKRLKQFIGVLLIIKAIMLAGLFLLNHSGLKFFVKLITMLEYAVDVEIYACYYPLITMIKKDDKLYSSSSLLYDGVYYLAVVVVGFLLGKNVLGLSINYNTYVLAASVFLILSAIAIFFVKMDNYISKEETGEYDGFGKLLKRLKGDKVSIFYLISLFAGQVSFYSALALLLTVLINNLGFTPTVASNIKLVTGVIGVLIGTIILKFLTFKNDYVNIGIKLGGRMIFYALAFSFNSPLIIFLALMNSRLLSSSYSHVTDAPYINRFSGKNQILFTNFRDMFSYFSRAIGTFLCGFLIARSIRYNFLIAFIFVVIQIIFMYLALYNKNKEAGRI